MVRTHTELLLRQDDADGSSKRTLAGADVQSLHFSVLGDLPFCLDFKHCAFQDRVFLSAFPRVSKLSAFHMPQKKCEDIQQRRNRGKPYDFGAVPYGPGREQVKDQGVLPKRPGYDWISIA